MEATTELPQYVRERTDQSLATGKSVCLIVKETAMQTDSELQQSVRRFIAERPDVGHGEIDVQVLEGIVTLTGTMRNENEKWQIGDAICAMPGVKSLLNHTMTVPSVQEGANDSDIARPWFPST